jgi:hypothetical protein
MSDLPWKYRAELRESPDGLRAAIAMSIALRDFIGVDLLTDDSGDSPREVPLLVRAKREADALAKTLHRLARGGAR